MIIGVKGLTYAPYTSGGDGSAVVYGTGVKDDDKMVHVDQSEERADDKFIADNKVIDRYNGIISASVAIELARLSEDVRTKILGHVKNGSVLSVTEDEAPFVGIGFIYWDRYKASNSFRAYWYHKVQFSEGSRSFNTKGENIEFQTESLEGEAMGVQLEADGKVTFYEYTEVATEAAARTWLNGKAGIS